MRQKPKSNRARVEESNRSVDKPRDTMQTSARSPRRLKPIAENADATVAVLAVQVEMSKKLTSPTTSQPNKSRKVEHEFNVSHTARRKAKRRKAKTA